MFDFVVAFDYWDDADYMLVASLFVCRTYYFDDYLDQVDYVFALGHQRNE